MIRLPHNSLKLMTMTQTGLIDSILDDVGLSQSKENSNSNDPNFNLKFPPKIKLGPLHNDTNTPPMTAS
jgi:hypothetical protein